MEYLIIHYIDPPDKNTNMPHSILWPCNNTFSHSAQTLLVHTRYISHLSIWCINDTQSIVCYNKFMAIKVTYTATECQLALKPWPAYNFNLCIQLQGKLSSLQKTLTVSEESNHSKCIILPSILEIGQCQSVVRLPWYTYSFASSQLLNWKEKNTTNHVVSKQIYLHAWTWTPYFGYKIWTLFHW